jgi:hypothetical protein
VLLVDLTPAMGMSSAFVVDSMRDIQSEPKLLEDQDMPESDIDTSLDDPQNNEAADTGGPQGAGHPAPQQRSRTKRQHQSHYEGVQRDGV